MSDTRKGHRAFLRFYGWLFAAGGACFILAPWAVSWGLGWLAGQLPGAAPVAQGEATYWLVLTGSMMAMIAQLASSLARDPGNGLGWRTLLISKAVSTMLFAAFAALERNTLFLAGAAVDGAILAHLLILCRAAAEAGDEAGAYEAWFLRLRDAASGSALWLRHVEYRGPRPRAELWWTLYDPSRAGVRSGRRVESRPERRRLPPAPLLPPAELFSHDGEARWQVAVSPGQAPPFRFAPFVTGAGLASAAYEAPSPWALAEGRAVVDGAEFAFSAAEASVGRIRGRASARAWRWLHATIPAGPRGTPTVIEALSVRVEAWPFGWLTAVHLWHHDRHRRADGPWRLVTSRSERDGDVWRFRADLGDLVVYGECGPDRDRMAHFTYPDCDGRSVRVSTSMTGWAALELRAAGSDRLERLETRSAAAVEFGGSEA